MQLCEYGCGKEALFQLKNGKHCCSSSSNKCIALRQKNSNGLKKNYRECRRIKSGDFPLEVRLKMGASNRGKTKFNCDHILKKSITQKINFENGKWFGSMLGKKHLPETKEKIRNWIINYIEETNNGKRIAPVKGKYENEFLDELQRLCNYTINRQFRTHGYFIDGYIHELHLAIELDESFHINEINRTRDIEREQYLCEKLNCRFFRVNEIDWLNNKEEVIKKFLVLCPGGVKAAATDFKEL